MNKKKNIDKHCFFILRRAQYLRLYRIMNLILLLIVILIIQFTSDEYDLLRKCAFMLIHKNSASSFPSMFFYMAIQFLCAIILQYENFNELKSESDEA